MVAIPMNVADVSALARAYPDRDEYRQRAHYDGANLHVPDDMVERVRAVDMAAAHKAVLVRYANWKQMEIANGGRTINGTVFPTGADDRAAMSSKAARLMLPNPPGVVNWQVGSTEFVPIPASDFIAIAAALDDFVQSTFDALPVLLARIADGTVSTREQIDAELSALLETP